MTASQPPVSGTPAPRRERRAHTTLVAFVVGLPLAAGVLYLLHFGPLRDTPARRYVSHPVEFVEVGMFCCALGALGAKLLGSRREGRACRVEVLPPWDGKAVPVAEAAGLLAGLNRLPRRLQSTLIVRRTAAVLDFLDSRRSAAELDDHLRALADNDAVALEGSYAFTRFLTWAIPILGFLGTVLGITGAISGVTPEVLEQSLSTVTDGLALAFDATALALALTMLTMFLSFIVERAEQSVLEAVDRYADRELAHRFERTGSAGGEVVEVVRRQSEVLVQAAEQLVERQAAAWARALEEVDRRRAAVEQHSQESFTKALEAALARTLEAHESRLTELENKVMGQSAGLVERLGGLADAVREANREQQLALAQVARGVAAQVEALVSLQENERQLLRLQETLAQNLTALAGAGAFEEAVHSLTAAAHLLTARATPAGNAAKVTQRPGAAA
jgi:biopolymer transport protein ExbB/TolQ